MHGTVWLSQATSTFQLFNTGRGGGASLEYLQVMSDHIHLYDAL